MSIDNGEIIRRLRAIDGGSFGGSAENAFRMLCAKAEVCSNCCQPYRPPGIDCACTLPVHRKPARKVSTS